MVQQYKCRSQFDFSYSLLCPVYFYRYPNPLATHVLSVDVLSRDIVKRPFRRRANLDGSSSSSSEVQEGEQEQQNVLKTTRLILKKGNLPSWAPKGLIRNAESWVLEESEVELDRSDQKEGLGREFRVWTRNLDHTTVLAVTESNIFRERQQQQMMDEKKDDYVSLKSIYHVTSNISFTMLRSRIEKFGLNRVLTHVDSSRDGILHIYARFLEERMGIPAIKGTIDPPIFVDNRAISKQQSLLRAALRPPFLDGDFVGPIARMKRRLINIRAWWRGLDRGGSGGVRSNSLNQLEDSSTENHLSPTERLRKRYLHLRDQGRSAFKKEQEDDDDD